MKRLKWKNDLVQNAEEALSREPTQLPNQIKYAFECCLNAAAFNSHLFRLCLDFFSLDASSDYMYRRFLVRGTLQPQKSVLIGPKKYGDVMGYHLIMPLVRSPEPGAPSTASPSTVLINLGFISNEAAGSYRSLPFSSSSPVKVKSSPPESNGNEAIIEALIPAPQAANWFTPENKPEQGEWVWADVQALTQYAGGEDANVVPLLMEEVFGSYVDASRVACYLLLN